MKTRDAAAWSVLAFGLYMGSQGLLLMFVPNLLLRLLGLAPAADAWPRTVGLALVVLATYYSFAFVRDDRGFFRLSSFVRMAQLTFFVGLFAAGLIQVVLVGTAAVEFAAGVVTWWLLRSSREAAS
jgi:hypothetical protein